MPNSLEPDVQPEPSPVQVSKLIPKALPTPKFPNNLVHVTIPLEIEGEIEEVLGFVTEVDVHYFPGGLFGTIRVPANCVVFEGTCATIPA
jgi:hypothetical protein